jgi:hypothetical protein
MAIVRAFSTGRTVAGGVLRRKDGLVAAPYEVRVLNEDDHPRLRALHHEVVAAVAEGMVARESDEFLARNLGPGGSTFGVLVGDELVGYAILSFPRGDDDNLAAPWAPDPRRCACLDGAGVLPAWRGNRLQRLLTGCREHRAGAAATELPRRRHLRMGARRGAVDRGGGCHRGVI